MTYCAGDTSRMSARTNGGDHNSGTDPLIMDSASFLDELLHNTRENDAYYVPDDTNRSHASPKSLDPTQTSLVRYDAVARNIVLHLHSPGVT